VTNPTEVVREASFDELDTATLYEILRLRTDVFVVEQACAYPELDGRDRDPGTVHLWIGDGAPLAYVRVLAEGDERRRIGRVVTAPAARGRGLAEQLVRHALERHCPGEVVLAAQSYLESWYRRLGFAVCGPAFVEDGIEHLPMRRA
jgi:ElaA protein